MLSFLWKDKQGPINSRVFFYKQFSYKQQYRNSEKNKQLEYLGLSQSSNLKKKNVYFVCKYIHIDCIITYYIYMYTRQLVLCSLFFYDFCGYVASELHVFYSFFPSFRLSRNLIKDPKWKIKIKQPVKQLSARHLSNWNLTEILSCL